MTEKSKKSFILYTDFEDALLRLSLKERGMLITMIYSYVNRGNVPDDITVTPLTDMAFAIIRAQLDRDKEKYDRICERNAANGSKGGRPTKTQKTQWVFEKTKKADNDNENDNEKENDSDIDIERLASRRSFDVDDFFTAMLRRTYGDKREKEKEKKEKG